MRLRLKLYQNMVNYKTNSFQLKETYPLPYSSVIGMVHSVCSFKNIIL